MKPGRKTSEFWLTLLAQVVGFVVLFGVVTAEDAQTMVDAIEKVVESIVGLVIVLAPLREYIKGRAHVKSAAEYAKEK